MCAEDNKLNEEVALTAHQKIKITHVLEATTGGTRRHLVDLMTHLDPERFEKDVVCATRRDHDFLADIDRMRAAGTCVSIVQMVRPIAPWHDVPALLKLIRHLRRAQPQVVHTHSAKAGFLGRLAARIARVPIIIHSPHQFPFEMHVASWQRQLYLWLEKRAAAWCSRIVCVCPNERKVAIAAGVTKAERLVVIRNGVDLPPPHSPAAIRKLRHELDLPQDAVVIGFVGRMAEQKDPLTLLRAFKHAAATHPEVRLVMVGEGPLRKTLVHRAEAAGISDICRFLGHREDPGRFYPVFDVVAMPSRWDALPYVLLDAMAHGRAVAASSVGGIPDVAVNEQNALLMPPGDVDALAEGMLRLVSDGALRRRLGKAATETIFQNFRLSQNVDAIAQLYESLVREYYGKAL